MENKKETGKVKKFMKEHGKDILVGIAGGAIFVSGVIVGKKIVLNNLQSDVSLNKFGELMNNVRATVGNNKTGYLATYTPGEFTVDDLGKVGNVMIEYMQDAGFDKVKTDSELIGVIVCTNNK